MPEKFEDQKQEEKRSPEYGKTLEEIENVIKLSKSEQQKYIGNRLANLSLGAGAGSLSHFGSHGFHKGFLGSEMKIFRSLLVDPFIVDDPELYSNLLETIKDFRNADGWKERTLREIIPTAIQCTIARYFGNAISDSHTEAKNEEFYVAMLDADKGKISIKELKGKGIAVCAEKGAVAQNLLSFVGLESDIIISSGCKIPAESKNEDAHCFILIHGENGDMIYDPTNPKVVSNKDKNLLSYNPAIYTISTEQAENLISGGSIKVEHIDERISEDGKIKQKKSNHLYSGPEKKR